MVRIAIIGTAGRKIPDDISPKVLTKELFFRMVISADYLIKSLYTLREVELVSGGSAWSDHIAVFLYLYFDYPKLTIYTPSEFTVDGFKENTMR
ncbi:MAG TPA: hypothetical protein VKR58_11200, partial [Aquella sp.]|nr:hypothetical protein [Aquella sp.]